LGKLELKFFIAKVSTGIQYIYSGTEPRSETFEQLDPNNISEKKDACHIPQTSQMKLYVARAAEKKTSRCKFYCAILNGLSIKGTVQ
jgi:hypothetical protein